MNTRHPPNGGIKLDNFASTFIVLSSQCDGAIMNNVHYVLLQTHHYK